MKHADALQEPADAIVVECELEQPPETVWRALTEPEILAEWLMPDGEDMSARPGPAEPEKIECELLNAEPNRVLQYSWRETGSGRPAVLDSVVTFVLTATPAGGTHLRVVHGQFELHEPGTLQAPAETACASGNVVDLFSRRRHPPVCSAAAMRMAA
jgi:uncharacterized protein YndB with AHSA1/START domain